MEDAGDHPQQLKELTGKYACINAFAEGAKGKNEIEIIETDKVNVSPCKGCGACGCTKGCVAKDDSNEVVDKIAAADMIVFASPIYWWGLTVQLKTVFVRDTAQLSW